MNKFLPLCFLLVASNLFGQIGGENVFKFLNLSPSARTTGLSGSLIAVKDDDVTLAVGNPSLLNPTMHQQLSFNHNIHLAGINNGYVGYGHHVNAWKLTFHGGIQYINYGDFDRADEFGTIDGTFKAAEYALTLGAGYQLYENLSVGANLKFVTSQFDANSSSGLAIDLAAFYRDSVGRFSATLIVKNAGVQFSPYEGNNREALPFEIQAGISQRLQHLPFRLSITYRYIDRWNILYDDPNQENEVLTLGDSEPQEPSAFSQQLDNFFRHLTFSGEFLFGKKDNFRMRVGYNHFLRKELTVGSFRSLAGFSMGLGLKINRFRIDYGRAFYHHAGALNHFSISTNLKEFRR